MATTAIKNILDTLRARNVRISLNGERLQVEAARGVIDEQLRQLIKDNKEALVAYIRQVMRQEDITIQPAPMATSYPLSSSQRRLWILSQLEADDTAYHIAVGYRFEGTLEVQALEKAFQRLIERHEILRTVFRVQEDGEPVQVVLPAEHSGFSLLQDDLRDRHDKDEEIRKRLNEALMVPFTLTTPPLLRAGLYRTADDQWTLLAVIHHIVSDAWSMNILMQELMQFYFAESNGGPATTPLKIQYKDYASWQQQQLLHGGFDEHRAYWLSQFEQGAPVLRLRGDRPRPETKTYHGGTVRKEISHRLIQPLKTLTQENGTTLFAGLLATVQVLLSRYTGQREMVLGTLVAGRTHADLEDQIGFYVNTIALRLPLDAEKGFRQLLAAMKQTLSGAYKYQDYPFDELVKTLGASRDASRHPLFDVLVVLQDATPLTEKKTGVTDQLNVTLYDLPLTRNTSKFDLSFDFVETAAGLMLTIEYNSDIYLPASIYRMGDHLEKLLEVLLQSPDHAVGKADYLTENEKQALIAQAGHAAADYFMAKQQIQLAETAR
ncbi:hypothetical protein HF329_09965 [Chitinophaga oryzae]|uniref:HxxPF-repeated domain-containing protein n=1 Tax=Chitinophaga oryzae TaxID=2725414 RepID=A0AAE6ZGI8_9BACT|nr:condensation domain-containing protein [Chitinophaga oryzae]QJB31617.1 hypothetical protein HF329_09965 [Chitinophaga oryzae]